MSFSELSQLLKLAGAAPPAAPQPSSILRDVVECSTPFVVGEVVEEEVAAVPDERTAPAPAGQEPRAVGQGQAPAEPAPQPLDPLAALRQAYLEAENVVHAARREAERLHEEARRLGYEEGYAAGYQEAQAAVQEQMAAQVERLAALAGHATTEVRAALREAEDQLVRLALAIAERIILREVRLDRSIVLALASRALEELDAGVTARVRVHPDDIPVLEPWEAHLNGDGRAARVELVPDPRVVPGGCIVEAGSAVVDAQLQTLLHEAAAVLSDVAPRNTAEPLGLELPGQPAGPGGTGQPPLQQETGPPALEPQQRGQSGSPEGR
jgi:flagellar assembly protein FliH